MYSLVMFYSLTGRSRYEASRIAKETGSDIYEIHEQRHRSMFNAYLFGPGQARGRRFVYIEPIAVDIEEYDKIIIVCPIWGGYPAPAFNNIVSELPPDKEVEIYLTCDSGKVKSQDETTLLVERQGVRVTGFHVIKTQDLNKRDKLHMKKLRDEKKAKEKLGIKDEGNEAESGSGSEPGGAPAEPGGGE